MVNFSQFQFLAQQPLPTPHLQRDLAVVSLGLTLTQPVGTSLDNMDPVLQVFGICVLMLTLTDNRGADTGKQSFSYYSMLQVPTPPAEVTSKEFKEPTLSFPLNCFLFLPLMAKRP